MKPLYILLLISIVFCTSFKAEKVDYVNCLNILQMKNESLLPILDSIVRHEKQCVYYAPELIFEVYTQNNNSIIELQIRAIGSVVGQPDIYKGCFEFRRHLFLVWGKDYNVIFKKTNKKKPISYVALKDGEVLEEDNTFSIWAYHYINNNFIFKELYDMFCKSLTPIKDRDRGL